MSARMAGITVARALDAMKAEDVVLLDVSEVSPIAEYFVLATGTAARHVSAMAAETVAVLKAMEIRPAGVDGAEQGTWAVVDYGPLVVHIFQRAARDYYDLEMLWGDGRRIKWKAAERRASA
jgi:ribosome-associated protein